MPSDQVEDSLIHAVSTTRTGEGASCGAERPSGLSHSPEPVTCEKCRDLLASIYGARCSSWGEQVSDPVSITPNIPLSIDGDVDLGGQGAMSGKTTENTADRRSAARAREKAIERIAEALHGERHGWRVHWSVATPGDRLHCIAIARGFLDGNNLVAVDIRHVTAVRESVTTTRRNEIKRQIGDEAIEQLGGE